jgi:hypothetical protein
MVFYTLILAWKIFSVKKKILGKNFFVSQQEKSIDFFNNFENVDRNNSCTRIVLSVASFIVWYYFMDYESE